MEKDTATVDMELQDGSKYTMTLQDTEVDEWEEIEADTNALICLVNGQQMLISIIEADWDGVSFKVIGDNSGYYYEKSKISWLMVEVKE